MRTKFYAWSESSLSNIYEVTVIRAWSNSKALLADFEAMTALEFEKQSGYIVDLLCQIKSNTLNCYVILTCHSYYLVLATIGDRSSNEIGCAMIDNKNPVEILDVSKFTFSSNWKMIIASRMPDSSDLIG